MAVMVSSAENEPFSDGCAPFGNCGHNGSSAPNWVERANSNRLAHWSSADFSMEETDDAAPANIAFLFFSIPGDNGQDTADFIRMLIESIELLWVRELIRYVQWHL